jgi:ER-bound oxygenase mpaB/B'/Rubber oxygenase, catalytic domain
MNKHMTPSRFINASEASSAFGSHRVERLAGFLNLGDDLADAATRALNRLSAPEQKKAMRGHLGTPDDVASLYDEAKILPLWVDPKRCRRGGEVILRAGLLSGLVLGLRSLISGYCSPAGNKPLIFTGRLESDVPQRLHNTARFVRAICETGIEKDSAGFQAALHVRLMHSRVRVDLAQAPQWKTSQWGTPINQYDMAGTILLFSYILVDGIEKLGFECSAQEREDVLHLWRAVGHVMGVNHELLATNWNEAQTLWHMLEATQSLPDGDSIKLTTALIEGPLKQAKTKRQQVLAQQWVKFSYQASRALIGPRYADALGYPKASLIPPFLILKTLMKQASFLRKFVPLFHDATLKVGQFYWERATQAPNRT